MRSPFFSVQVRVPATSANLGPGFDVLGIALTLYDEFDVELGGGGPALSLEVSGKGADNIPRDETNLVYRALERAFKKAGRPVPAARIKIRLNLPVAGGLGSSSAAIVGGLVAANAALGNPFDVDDLVNLATGMEGHPDNVTPALAGGFCTALVKDGRVRYAAWREASLFKGLRAVACVPEFKVLTETARRALPGRVPRADAVFNAAHVALLLAAVRDRRFDLLGEAMDDRLHQPYRARFVPGMAAVIQAAKRAGAYGAALSGAGPTVLALSPANRAAAAGRAMERAFARHGARARAHVLKVDTRGARVVSIKGKAR
jgi:homoserine kinase